MLKKLWKYIREVKSEAHKGYYYDTLQVLFVWICGTICGQPNMKSCWIWMQSEEVKQLMRETIGMYYFPKYPMFTIILDKVDKQSLEKQFRAWVKELLPNSLSGKVVSFDGKTICSTANSINYEKPLHIVSAYITELGLTLGQLAVNDKTNEIPTVQQLIEELDLEGTIIVADALNCQKKLQK